MSNVCLRGAIASRCGSGRRCNGPAPRRKSGAVVSPPSFAGASSGARAAAHNKRDHVCPRHGRSMSRLSQLAKVAPLTPDKRSGGLARTLTKRFNRQMDSFSRPEEKAAFSRELTRLTTAAAATVAQETKAIDVEGGRPSPSQRAPPTLHPNKHMAAALAARRGGGDGRGREESDAQRHLDDLLGPVFAKDKDPSGHSSLESLTLVPLALPP